MIPLIALAVPVLLVGFWLWMFREMSNNPDIPPKTTTAFKWPPTTKYEWMLAFIIFNVFAAGYYYFTVYRNS